MQRTVLLSQFCPPVRPSVRLSVRRVYCDKAKWCIANILIPHETAITLVSDTNTGWWAMPLPCQMFTEWPTPFFEKRRLRQISAHNVSTVRDGEKSSIMTNIKSTMGFPTSYRWSAYVTPKSSKVWPKERFFLFSNSQLQSNKVCYKVSLCENFLQQSCSTAIPVPNGP